MTENTQQENVWSYLRSVWRRGQKHAVSAGLLAFVRWAVPLFLVGMTIDWLTRMPAPGRIAIFAILIAVSLYKAWRHGWRHLRAFNAARVALRVEDHHGGLDSLVVSAVQFQESAALPGTSAAMRGLTLSNAEQAVVDLPAREVVSYSGLRRSLALALTLALTIVGFAVVNGPFLAAGIARICPPWSDIEYPTRTQLEILSGVMVVQEGAPALIRARVSGVIPNEAQVALRTGTGKPRVRELDIVDGIVDYPIDSAFRGFEYRIMAGDARSAWYAVEVIAALRIERARISLEYPAYTERESQVVEALTVMVPEETRIEWELTLDRAVSEAIYTPAGRDPRPLVISADGRTVTMAAVATESRAYRFSWVDKEHGFSFTSTNHYLQVMPDQAPRVELTSPANNLYATLGRQIDLAIRARDDHGVGESLIAYRVNKIEEVHVPFAPAKLSEGQEQAIDWDYRTALPDLVIGDSVSFVVEVSDRYPGAQGPQRARSRARRVTFLSEEDYLELIAKQRLRLLSRFRNIYREERAVHATVRDLDPTGDVFLQTCQLEAVRQDLIRERLGMLKMRVDDLLDDLAANNITDAEETATLARLSSELETVAEEHVARAAAALRELAGAFKRGAKSNAPDPAAAVHMVDSAARELALMVLQVGFNEATEVMARELHAIAEAQAQLRLETMIASSDAEGLANQQDELSQWITRLFASAPQDKESTIEDALVAFNLSRLIKELRNAGALTKMRAAVALIRKEESNDAVGLQAGVIKALLAAEFRLRVGSEREALSKAGDLFQLQVNGLQRLRAESAVLTSEQFGKRRNEFAQEQTALQRKLHLLLMPDVPAARARLFDIDLPPAPRVDGFLAAAEGAMESALAHIEAGELGAATTQQQEAESSFRTLRKIIKDRTEVLTERARATSRLNAFIKYSMELADFVERQLILLEMAEDAEDDSIQLAHAARLATHLVEDVDKFRLGVVKEAEGPELLPLLGKVQKTLRAMRGAVPALEANQGDDAIALQETALEALEDAGLLLEKQTQELTALSSTLVDAWVALTPAPYVADIQAEQRDLVEALPKAEESDLPRLAIVQKNLIHAVDAVLVALDPLSHQIESGTVFLFAKDDMDAAATALETHDLVEAEDAGSFVAESLQDLLDELEEVTPQYSYVLEVTEFFHEIVSEGMILSTEQGRLREMALAAPDAAALRGLAREQRELESRAQTFGRLLEKAMGLERFNAAALLMTAALSQLDGGEPDAAVEQMEIAQESLAGATSELGELMTHFAVLLQPLLLQPDLQVMFTLEVLATASQQKALYRKTQGAAPEQLAGLASKQRELATRCEGFIPRSYSHPKLIAAKQHMLQGASSLESSSREKALASQFEAGEVLRHFVIEYVQRYVIPPPPAPPEDAVPTDPTESLGDDFSLFMPGAVSGAKPKGGRQEWEVLGRRDRAALNENFARELPLEYRAILKDYFERLAR